MRLAFDVTSCVKERRGGIATYGWNLVQACARVAPEHEPLLGPAAVHQAVGRTEDVVEHG